MRRRAIAWRSTRARRKFDGGIVTRVDCVSLGIVVNRDAERFYDEGEDFWPKRYAIWGRLVAGQPDQIAYSIIDAKSMGKFMPPVFPPLKAATLRELAPMLGLDPAALEKTVADFNAAVRPGTFDHTILDDCRTEGLDAAEDPLGAGHRHAAVLCAYPAAPRHHLHLPRCRGRREGAHGARRRQGVREHLRRGRDHGRQRARQGLRRRNRHGHRHDVRPHRRRGGRAPCPRAEAPRLEQLVEEAQRVLSICNACRYCEGYCAVFPALERRLEFSENDVHYLANLCHNCGACLYACQYAPPHEFQLNFPARARPGAQGDVQEIRVARLPRARLRSQRPRGEPRDRGEPRLPSRLHRMAR